MTLSLWNLAAYALQLAALVTVAIAARGALRIRLPRHSLRFWQAVHGHGAALAAGSAAQCRAVRRAGHHRNRSRRPHLPGVRRSIVPAGIECRRALILVLAAAGIIARLLWLGLGLIRLRSIVARAEHRLIHSRTSPGELTQIARRHRRGSRSRTMSKGPRRLACGTRSSCCRTGDRACPPPSSGRSSATSCCT